MNCPHCNGMIEPPKGKKNKRWVITMIEMGRDSGWTLAQIAHAIGMHPSTVEKYCARLRIRKKLVTKTVEPMPDTEYS